MNVFRRFRNYVIIKQNKYEKKKNLNCNLLIYTLIQFKQHIKRLS